MSGASELSAISTALTISLRITEKVYEIIAVRQEAKDLLEITSRTTTKLDQARQLRRQKSSLLSAIEKSIIADAFQGAERAIETVARLVEPARADLDVSGGRDAGRVRLTTRMQFVFRDSAHIPVSLQKLNIASNDLNMAITTLTLKDGSRHVQSEGSIHFEPRAPPTYQESEFLHRSRERNMRRRESSMSLRSRRESGPIHHGMTGPEESIAELPCESQLESKLAEITLEEVLESPSDITTSRSKQTDELFLGPPVTAKRPEAPPIRALTGKARSRAWLERRMGAA